MCIFSVSDKDTALGKSSGLGCFSLVELFTASGLYFSHLYIAGGGLANFQLPLGLPSSYPAGRVRVPPSEPRGEGSEESLPSPDHTVQPSCPVAAETGFVFPSELPMQLQQQLIALSVSSVFSAHLCPLGGMASVPTHPAAQVGVQ